MQVDISDILECESITSADKPPIYKITPKGDMTFRGQKLFINLENSRPTKKAEYCEPIESELVKMFRTLNDTGQAVAIQRVEELTEIPRYTKKGGDSPDERK